MDTQELELQRLRRELEHANQQVQELKRELAGERAKLTAVFDVTPDLIIIKDRNSVFRAVNPAFCRFLGKSEAEIVGKTDYELFSPEDAALYVSGDAAVMESRVPEAHDWQAPVAYGSVWLHVVKAPVLDISGEVTGLLCSVRDISKRKQIELEFERVFNLVPDMVCTASPDGYFTKLNAAWEKSLGYTSEELLAIPFADLIHPDDRQATGDEVRRQLAGKGTICFINRYRRKDGSYRWFEWNTTPSAEGQLYGVARDITDRIQAEKETKLWADAFRFCSHGIAIGLPLTNTVLTCNEAFARMRMQPIRAIEGVTVASLYVPEDRERVIGHIREADYSGCIRFEGRMLRKDGSVFPVQVDVVSVVDEEGHLQYRIATVQDITGRLNSQKALRESEERFRSVVESAPEAIFIQIKGAFAYLNPAAVSLFGASDPAQLLGTPVLDRVHPDSRLRVAELIQQINDQRIAASKSERVLLRCDGTPVYVENSAVPFVYAGNKGALVFLRDISERKSAEQERVKLETQLLQSQRIESIGRLAGGVAHDLNNLLTPILGYAELLYPQFPKEDKRRKQIDVMHEAALKARNLVRQLLAFSSRQTLAFTPLDLNSVVRGFEHFLRRTLRANIDICFRLHEGVLSIRGDAGQLEQIIMNLAVNAADAMAAGGELVMETSRISVAEGVEKGIDDLLPGQYVMLSVTDNGSGIEREILDQVFEPFFTTKDKGHGTGLGLSTVYGIVRQHGGSIRVSSQPGQGSCFRIYFPENDIGIQAPAELPPVPVPERRRGGQVLVVEDDVMVRNFVVQALLAEGYDVMEAPSGEVALGLVTGGVQKPDLLLTDVVMPGMNGKELYDEVLKVMPEIRVLYMSGYTKNIITSHGVPSKGSMVLQKPFSVQTLVSRVRQVMNS